MTQNQTIKLIGAMEAKTVYSNANYSMLPSSEVQSPGGRSESFEFSPAVAASRISSHAKHDRQVRVNVTRSYATVSVTWKRYFDKVVLEDLNGHPVLQKLMDDDMFGRAVTPRIVLATVTAKIFMSFMQSSIVL